MVHTPSALGVQSSLSQLAHFDKGHDSAPTQNPYLLVPDTLILAFAHDPLAIGVYVAVARLALTARSAVPVAARDLTAWMGSDRDADRAAIMRRVVRLTEAGWLEITRDRAAKHRLLPTWGNDSSGKLRPWRFDREFYGKPEHVRGRRIPFVLLDTYIGRLETRPGQLRGLISRYLTRPLLDLTDVGTFTISLRCEIEPTARLMHLGLVHQRGMLVLPDNATLLTKAERGELTTIENGQPVHIHLSMQGRARLATLPTVCSCTEPPANAEGGSVAGSGTGSLEGSLNGSAAQADIQRTFPQHNGENVPSHESDELIAWEDGSSFESINHESPPAIERGGGIPQQNSATTYGQTADAYAQATSQIAPAIVSGHEALNFQRTIPLGEWHELFTVQQEHGAEQILIWQARASRVSQSRSYGITPGYYRTCAAQQKVNAEPDYDTADVPRKPISTTSKQSTLDPACDALLRQLGVRARQHLAHVPLQLIVEWQMALAHPGIAVRFASPLGFAITQMQSGNAPPPTEELEQWAEQAERSADRYQSWQFFQHETPDSVGDTLARDLEQRVRAIAPPDATLAELCALAELIEAGFSDQAVLAEICRMRGGATP